MRPLLSLLLAALLSLASSARAADDYPARREAMLAEFTTQIATLGKALERSPNSMAVLSRRGDYHLFLGHFKEAVADFEQMISIDPAQDPGHWRLGIAYYFTKQYEKSSQQFAKYHAFDGRDRENGVWKFLADARQSGVETARRQMLAYEQFDREPFPSLYEMFAGQKTGAEVLAEVQSKGLAEDPLVRFFAAYYVGLNAALNGDITSAKEQLGQAVATFAPTLGVGGGPGYMWQVARLHAEQLDSTP